MMNRPTHADSNIGSPADTLNKSMKYHTLPGIPPSAPAIPEALGSKGDIRDMNSVVMKKSAKKTTNLTITERNTNPRIVFAAANRSIHISPP